MIDYDHKENMIVRIDHGVIDNPKTEFHSFHQYELYMKKAKSTGEKIYALETKYRPSISLYEMPHITQDAMSAVLTGMMWSSIYKRDNSYHVEPRLIKEWSDSKKGDAKTVVRKRVYERLGFLPSKNNNVIDAIANCFMFIDLFKRVKYDNENK